jgi:hypothetical protein
MFCFADEVSRFPRDDFSSGSGTNSPLSIASTSPPPPPFPLEIEMPMAKRQSLDHETQRVLNALNNQPLFGQSAHRPIGLSLSSSMYSTSSTTTGFLFTNPLSLPSTPPNTFSQPTSRFPQQQHQQQQHK